MKFIELNQTVGDKAYINAAEIRGIFPAVNGGAVINLGTTGNVVVTESAEYVLGKIADQIV